MSEIIQNLLSKGPFNLTIALVEPLLSSLVLYHLMGKLLAVKVPKVTFLAFALLYALWSNLRAPGFIGTRYHFFMNLFVNVMTYFVIFFLFRGTFWKKLLVWWYFDIIRAMCQAVSFLPVLLVQSSRSKVERWADIITAAADSPLLGLLRLMTLIPLFLLVGSLSLVLWRKILMHRFQIFYLIVFALPMGQIYSLSRVINPNMGDWFFGILINFFTATQAYDILSIAGIAVCMVTSVFILFYILSQDKRIEMEAELKETKRIMELEHENYRETEKLADELAKIRHDFNNQLASIVQLVHAGEDQYAQNMIEALTVKVKKISE
jgi:sensor histidine kinase YesM